MRCAVGVEHVEPPGEPGDGEGGHGLSLDPGRPTGGLERAPSQQRQPATVRREPRGLRRPVRTVGQRNRSAVPRAVAGSGSENKPLGGVRLVAGQVVVQREPCERPCRGRQGEVHPADVAQIHRHPRQSGPVPDVPSLEERRRTDDADAQLVQHRQAKAVLAEARPGNAGLAEVEVGRHRIGRVGHATDHHAAAHVADDHRVGVCGSHQPAVGRERGERPVPDRQRRPQRTTRRRITPHQVERRLLGGRGDRAVGVQHAVPVAPACFRVGLRLQLGHGEVDGASGPEGRDRDGLDQRPQAPPTPATDASDRVVGHQAPVRFPITLQPQHRSTVRRQARHGADRSGAAAFLDAADHQHRQ